MFRMTYLFLCRNYASIIHAIHARLRESVLGITCAFVRVWKRRKIASQMKMKKRENRMEHWVALTNEKSLCCREYAALPLTLVRRKALRFWLDECQAWNGNVAINSSCVRCFIGIGPEVEQMWRKSESGRQGELERCQTQRNDTWINVHRMIIMDLVHHCMHRRIFASMSSAAAATAMAMAMTAHQSLYQMIEWNYL